MLDLAIAGGLVLVTIIVFLLNRAGVLPKKALPFVAAALAGAVGISIFRAKRRDQALQAVERKRQELKNHDQVLQAKKTELGISERDHAALKAQKELEVENSQKEVLLIEAEAENNRQKRAAEIKRISELQGHELDSEFDQAMRKLNAGAGA